jgi:hypothetical protein
MTSLHRTALFALLTELQPAVGPALLNEEPGMRRISSALLLVLAAACGGAQLSVSFDSVEVNTLSSIAAPRTVVVANTTDWALLWSEHTKGRIPRPALPPIDFSDRIVVGVFLGARPNGCHSVFIQSVHRAGDAIIVEYVERVPLASDLCIPGLFFPSHLVSIPRFGLHVEFVSRW